MKKIYMGPGIEIIRFSAEKVLTDSAVVPGTDPSNTTEENVNAYIEMSVLGKADATVRLTW